jgi:hypothetical protein
MPTGAACEDLAPYCAELRQVVAFATAKERFAPIAGSAREGNFADTRLPLSGWQDCALYGSRMYTCDSDKMSGGAAAEAGLASIVGQIKRCLGDGWIEISDRSSSTYVVLHGAGAISITVSTDRMDQEDFVVRLTLFPRAP